MQQPIRSISNMVEDACKARRTESLFLNRRQNGKKWITEFSYSEFHSAVLSIAHIITMRYQIRASEHVGIVILENTSESAMAILATLRIGAIPILITKTQDEHFIANAIKDTGIRLLFIASEVMPSYETLPPNCRIIHTRSEAFAIMAYRQRIVPYTKPPTGTQYISCMDQDHGITHTTMRSIIDTVHQAEWFPKKGERILCMASWGERDGFIKGLLLPMARQTAIGIDTPNRVRAFGVETIITDTHWIKTFVEVSREYVVSLPRTMQGILLSDNIGIMSSALHDVFCRVLRKKIEVDAQFVCYDAHLIPKEVEFLRLLGIHVHRL